MFPRARSALIDEVGLKAQLCVHDLSSDRTDALRSLMNIAAYILINEKDMQEHVHCYQALTRSGAVKPMKIQVRGTQMTNYELKKM